MDGAAPPGPPTLRASASRPPPAGAHCAHCVGSHPPGRSAEPQPCPLLVANQQAAPWGGSSGAWGGQKLPCSCTARRSPHAPLPSAPRRRMAGHRVGPALPEPVQMPGPPPGAWRWPSGAQAACPPKPRPGSGQAKGLRSWGRVGTPGTMACRGLGPDSENWRSMAEAVWVGRGWLALCPAPTCSCPRSQLGVSPAHRP